MSRINPNNPGVFTTYHDGSLIVPQTTIPTGNVTLTDFALWGAVNNPITVSTIDDASAVFGKHTGAYGDINRVNGYNGNALVLAAGEVLQAGNTNLTLVRPDFGAVAASTTLFAGLPKNNTFKVKVMTAGSSTVKAKLTIQESSPAGDLAASLAILAVGNQCYITSGANSATTIYTIADVTTYAGTHSVLLEINGNLPLTGSDPAVDWTFVNWNYKGISVAADSVGGIGVLDTVGLSSADEAALLHNISVGQICWNTAGGDYDDVDVYVVKNVLRYGSSSAPHAKIYLSSNSITPHTAAITPASGLTWVFAAGYSIAGAFPGAVGNVIKFRQQPSSDGLLYYYVNTPDEFGGFNYLYSSLYYPTIGALASKINTSLADVVSMSLVYAGGSESFGALIPGMASPPVFTGKILDSTAVVTTDIAYLDNPTTTDQGYCQIGNSHIDSTTILGQTLLVGDIPEVIGTDCAMSGSYRMNPTQSIVSSDLRHSWYAQVLGNVNNPDDGLCTLSIIRGQTIGTLVVPGLNMDDMVNAQGQIIQLSTVDPISELVIPYTAFSNNQSNALPNCNALQFLLDFAHGQNTDGISTDVVIGFSPLASTTLTSVKTRADFLKTLGEPDCFMAGTLKNTDGLTSVVDAGRYLSVVAGPQVIVTNNVLRAAYVTSGAIQYAALLSSTPSNMPPSQRTLSGVSALSYQFTRGQMSDLSGGQGPENLGGAYVVFDGITGVPTVNMAVTATARTSDYAKKHNVRVVQACGSAVRAAVRPFIGCAFGIQ